MRHKILYALIYSFLLLEIVILSISELDSFSPLKMPSSAQYEEWDRSWGGSNTEYGQGLVLDDFGNIYVVGHTSSYSDDSEAVVIKYDYRGEMIWENVWYHSGSEWSRDIAIGPQGNLYIVTNTFDDLKSDVILLKLSNNNGNEIWHALWGGNDSDMGWGVTTDSNGNVYVVGGVTSYGSGLSDIFLLKYGLSANIIWNRTWGSPKVEIAKGVAVDSIDNVYVVGYVQNSQDEYKMCLLKYSGAGELIWTRICDIPGYHYGNSIYIDSEDNIYIGGGLSHLTLASYDTNGNLLWTKVISNREECIAITMDSAEQYIYAIGKDLFNNTEPRVFIDKFYKLGGFCDELLWGSDFTDKGYDIALNDVGQIYFTGRSGSDDIFLAKRIDSLENCTKSANPLISSFNPFVLISILIGLSIIITYSMKRKLSVD